MQDTKGNAWFQVNVTRPKKFPMRSFYSRGSGLLAFADPCYIQLPNKKIFKFLVVGDSCSKYVFATILPEVNPKQLKLAFTRLFKHQQLSYYPYNNFRWQPITGEIGKTIFF